MSNTKNSRHNKKHKRHMGKRILTMLLSFFLSIGLFGVLINFELYMGFLNESVFRKSMLETRYVREVSGQIIDEINSLLYKSGIPDTVKENLISENDVYIAVNNAIEGMLDKGKENSTELYVTDFKERFREGIVQYLEEQEVYTTPQLSESVDEIVSGAGGIYRKYICSDLIGEYEAYRTAASDKCMKVAIVSLIITAVCICLLFAIYKYRHHVVRKIIYSFSSVCIWNIITTFYIIARTAKIGKNLFPQYYLDFLKQYLSNALYVWYIVTGILVLITGILFVVVKQLKHKSYNVSR